MQNDEQEHEREREQLLAVLFCHTGKSHGITAGELARLLSISPRQVRHYITELRLQGKAICGHPGSGYFLAETDAEIVETCAFLRQRAMHSLELEAVLMKVPLPEILGQLRLRT